MSAGRPRRGRQQKSLAGKGDAGALDEDAQPGGRVAERVDDLSPIHLNPPHPAGKLLPIHGEVAAKPPEGLRGPGKPVHILDDPMPDYGDHESSDDPLQILRHSTAHLLAAAVTELYPEAKYGIGPAGQDPRLLLRLRLQQADL